MNSSLRLRLLAITFTSCSAFNAYAIEVSQKQIRDLITQAQTSGNLPAVGALIEAEGKTIYFETVGKRSLQNSAKAKKPDQWHLGSDTKAMTAYLLALAVQDGRLSFDTHIVDFVANHAVVNPINRDLTLRDILSHGSGLHDVGEIQNGELWKELSKSTLSLVEQRKQMMEAALQESPYLNPNNPTKPLRSFSYANINYMIVGAILEKIYTKPWENLIKEKLFLPLNMSSCGFGVSGDKAEIEPSQPWPHVLQDGELIGVPPKYKLDNPPMLGPAGTVHCNLEDWGKFVAEVASAWKGEGQLLTDALVTSVYFSNALDSSYTYGGWGRADDKFGTPVLLHDGSNTFNYAVAMLAPDKDTFILLTTNTAHPDGEAAMLKLKKSLAELILKP